MKKAGLRLLHPAGFNASKRKSGYHQKEQTMQFSEARLLHPPRCLSSPRKGQILRVPAPTLTFN